MLKVAKQTKHMDNKESKEEIGQGNKTNTEDYNPKKKKQKKNEITLQKRTPCTYKYQPKETNTQRYSTTITGLKNKNKRLNII